MAGYTMNDVGRMVLVVLVILLLHLTVEHVKAQADSSLVPERSLVAVEGYGARCAVLYSHGRGIGKDGSGSIHCSWENRTYQGDWRPVQPRSD